MVSAAGGQNIAVAGASVLLLIAGAKKWTRGGMRLTDIRRENIIPASSFLAAYLVWLVVSSCLSPQASGIASISFAGGFLPLLCVPLLVAVVCREQIDDAAWRVLARALAGVAIITAALALSQMLWPWQITRGWHVIWIDNPRARGFYSHPLTFAYIGFLFWPIACWQVLKKSFQVESWLMFLATGTILWASESRVIQLIALVILILNIFQRFRGKLRIMILGLSLLTIVGLFSVDSQVKTKILGTIHQTHDHQSDYPDDRLAFWDVHWRLFLTSPWVGHGTPLSKEVRVAAYDVLGLAQFSKKYNAHNSYLQILAESGVVGLALFLSWMVLLISAVFKSRRGSAYGGVLLQTWIGFSVASITQNSFQDIEVRYGVMVLTIATGFYLYRYSRSRFT